MEVGGVNLQGGISYNQAQPEVKAVEAPKEQAAVQAATTEKPAVNTESVQKKAEGEENADSLSISAENDRYLEESLRKGIDEANKRLQNITSNELQYSYHKKTKTVMVKVINTDTKEVVREIPAQKALDAIAKMWELAGILVDERK